MRCRMLTFIILGTIGASGLSGQGMPRTGPPDRAIQRHWPDDGAQAPTTPKANNWDGNDAVGLQFSERNPAAGSVVPMSVLKMSGAARKEMRKSDDALLAGDYRGSAEHLEKMLSLAPDVALGHNALGARYVALHQYDKAVEEFQRAVTLRPDYRLAVDNLVVTMCLQHRYAEAEGAARWALQIQPEAASSKYLLGSVLVSEDKTTEEASRLLESVQGQYPRARLFLAKSYVAHADIEKAADELRAYIASPQATDNGVAQEWLGRLENELAAKRSRNTPTGE